jgi:hypothetical protein
MTTLRRQLTMVFRDRVLLKGRMMQASEGALLVGCVSRGGGGLYRVRGISAARFLCESFAISAGLRCRCWKHKPGLSCEELYCLLLPPLPPGDCAVACHWVALLPAAHNGPWSP